MVTTLKESEGIQTTTTNEAIEENTELNNLRDTLMDKLEKGELDVGAPILNLEAAVVIPVDTDDGFTNLCRFYNFGNYTAIINSNDENLARTEKLKFVDVACDDCSIKENCGKYLDNVCKTNSTFIGEDECEKQLNPVKDDDKETTVGDVLKNLGEDDVEFEKTLGISFLIFAILNLFN